MAKEVMDIIGKLKSEAVERCKRRIQQAAENRDGCTKRAERRVVDHGITSVMRKRHGL